MTHNGEAERLDPHAAPSNWGPRLARILTRQTELYERLLELTEEQSGLIDREDGGEALLDLLRSRQGYVDEVAEHNELLQPFVDRWEELSAALEEPMRSDLSTRLASLMDLIDRMVARDDEGRQAIATRRENLGNELADLSRNKAAVGTYARTGVTNPPRYQDRRA